MTVVRAVRLRRHRDVLVFPSGVRIQGPAGTDRILAPRASALKDSEGLRPPPSRPHNARSHWSWQVQTTATYLAKKAWRKKTGLRHSKIFQALSSLLIHFNPFQSFLKPLLGASHLIKVQVQVVEDQILCRGIPRPSNTPAPSARAAGL